MLLTADVVNDTRQLAREAGVDAFLSKPLRNRDLERAILACGLYAPQTPAGRRVHTVPQCMMSDYELPGNIDVPASDEPAGGTASVDWPALQELTQIMSQPDVEEQLQALYSPGTGALAECTTAVLHGGIAQQRAAIHKLKGSLLLLGLQAMAVHGAKGEDKLKARPPQTLGRPWTTGLNTLAQKAQAELAVHFAMRS